MFCFLSSSALNNCNSSAELTVNSGVIELAEPLPECYAEFLFTFLNGFLIKKKKNIFNQIDDIQKMFS